MQSGKFIKIQDGTIIRRDSLTGYHKDKYDPNGCHYYIAMYNKRSNSYHMYPTSHYVDPKKKTDIRKGRAIIMKIKGADGYSTVYKQARKHDIHGQPFRENFKKYEKAGKLSPYQLKRFKSFIARKKK